MFQKIAALVILILSAVNAYHALEHYPQSIDPLSAAAAVFCFGVAIIIAMRNE